MNPSHSKMARRWLVVSTLVAVIATPFGIIPLVLNILAYQKAESGLAVEDDHAFRKLLLWTKITVFLTLAVIILVWCLLAKGIRLLM